MIRDTLDAYRPRATWWARPAAVDDIHGRGHCARVLLWADYVAARLAADGVAVDRAVVRWAAACHDCRRHADGLDPDHGWRAAAWFGEHAAALDPTLTPAQVQAVQHAITWHVPPDAVCPRWTPELRALKDADALDRVRLGNFDSRYLRTPYLYGREADAAVLLGAYPPGQPGDPWPRLRAAAQVRGLWPAATTPAR